MIWRLRKGKGMGQTHKKSTVLSVDAVVYCEGKRKEEGGDGGEKVVYHVPL